MNARSMPPLDEDFDGPVAVPLASYEAEHAVLGSLLMSSALYDVVGDILQPADFADETHGAIYGAISALAVAAKAVDPLTVYEQLRCAVELKYLNDLAQAGSVNGSSARRYAEIVRERAQSRQLLGVVDKARELARDHALPIGDRIEQVSAQLAGLVQDGPGDEWVSSDAGMVEFLSELDERCVGIEEPFLPTGLRDLDHILDGGTRPGDYVVIGARPSMGKTALAATIGMHAAKLGQTVAMFSLEMSRASLYERQVAMESEVSLSLIRRPKGRMLDNDFHAVTAAAERIRKLPFYVNDRTGLNINTLRTKARALKRRHGLRLLIVDYLGLMEPTNPKDNRTAQLGEISRNLKKLAKELGITVLLLVQLNREVEKRVDQMPMMSDLRECGDVEQDADIIIFPHRPIHLKPSLGDAWRYYACLRVAKQRGGATGDLNLKYTGHLVRFENWNGEKPSTTPGRSADFE
ncbi:replicative DNA helicase [Delftia tsuruhatensis]|uniref:replicative DNA helicase n=1 Tax=Delftia tsuruhatensis TaxID=180282 RepID=UPI002446D646|nr:replicative DNA helicase [Delftia tsuruhatensis]MDH2234157.1 replicative DNA helicase [Delftia tsuruhatensis]